MKALTIFQIVFYILAAGVMIYAIIDFLYGDTEQKIQLLKKFIVISLALTVLASLPFIMSLVRHVTSLFLS